MGVFDWLNTNAGGVQGVSTIVLVIVTIGYVILTGRLAKQARLSTAAAERSAEAAEKSAAASAQLVEESRIGRLAATEPQVYPASVQIRPGPVDSPIAGYLMIELTNAGPGAAYDVAVSYRTNQGGGTLRVGEPIRSQDSRPVEGHLGSHGPLLDRLPIETRLRIAVEYRGIHGARQRLETDHMIMRGAEQNLPCPMIGSPRIGPAPAILPEQADQT